MVKARDYINNYGSKYGISNGDIGYTPGKGGTGSVTIGGKSLITPTSIQNGSAYADENSLRSAIDSYAQSAGMKDKTIPTFTPAAAPAPYKSEYSNQINDILDKILNTGSFDYNAESDPAFQSYKTIYGQEGDKALANTMADASAQTGGQLNSWAVSAGQQAKNDWNSKLTGIIPSLEANAYSKYQGELSNEYNQLNALNTADTADYSKYRDKINDYNTKNAADRGAFESDRTFNTGIDQFNTNRNDALTQNNITNKMNENTFNENVRSNKVGEQINAQNANTQRLNVTNSATQEANRLGEQIRSNKAQEGISARNAATNEGRLSWDKDPTNPANNKPKPGDLQTQDYVNVILDMKKQTKDVPNPNNKYGVIKQPKWTDQDYIDYVDGLGVSLEDKANILNSAGVKNPLKK